MRQWIRWREACVVVGIVGHGGDARDDGGDGGIGRAWLLLLGSILLLLRLPRAAFGMMEEGKVMEMEKGWGGWMWDRGVREMREVRSCGFIRCQL